MDRGQEINQRLQEIAQEIETRGDNITAEELQAFETEVRELTAERTRLFNANEQRRNLLNNIANSTTEQRSSQGIDFVKPLSQDEPTETRNEDPYDTVEYRKAFMEYTCRGVQLPVEYRSNDTITTTENVGAVIPTTILNEIIQKAETYGNIFKRIRRLNIQGGVRVPIMTLMPEAKWIDEENPSPTQKLEAKNSVMFGFYGLEVKIAQTLLVSVVTLAEFQRQFVRLATEAIVKAIEKAIFNGSGNGTMLGVLNEPRIPVSNNLTLNSEDFSSWRGWKKNVFANMKKSYRNGIFIMAQGTFDGYIDGMVDTTGQPIGRINYGITDGETYRFGGKDVEIVEDDILPSYEDANVGDVVAVFMRLEDYAVNTNMQMRVVHWRDEDNNVIKNKCIIILDGKVLDANGILLIRKGDIIESAAFEAGSDIVTKDKKLETKKESKKNE